MAAERITLSPVEADGNISTIKEFRTKLQTALGGSLKAVVTAGGILELGNGTSGILHRLELVNPVCRLIAQVATGLPNHELYFCVLVSHLIEQYWSYNDLSSEIIEPLSLSDFIKSLIATCEGLLSSDLIRFPVDFESIHSFFPLVKSIIRSKCGIFVDRLCLKRDCGEIVKAFLNSIDEKNNSVGRVYVKVRSGPNKISTHNGLLYQVTEDHDLKYIEEITGNVKVIVFTIKMESLIEDGLISSDIIKIHTILDRALKLNTKVVACQQTVADDIKLKLMRKKVVLLERMGTDFTRNLVQMTGALPISHTSLDLNDLDNMLGNLTELKSVKFDDVDYLLLQSEIMAVSTLLITNYSLAGEYNLKEVVEQAIGALKDLVLHPAVTPGGGCLETWIIAQISQVIQERHGCKQYRNVLLWFQQALLSACSCQRLTLLDSVYHHGWTEDAVTCGCGLFTRTLLQEVHGELIPICDLSNTRLDPPQLPVVSLADDITVDCHHQKVNVTLSALETFDNLSNIGLILYN